MEPSRPGPQYDVVVIGAGLSGLACGYFAKKNGKTVAVFESSEKTGGVIQTEIGNEFLLEHGPNTVLPTPELMELVQDLDLSNEMLLANPKIPRFIQRDGQLFPIPLSPVAFFKTPLLSLKGKLRILGEPFIGKSANPLESLMDFATRRLGQEVAERLLAPFVSGVWAGDPNRLSPWAFPRLAMAEQNFGSIMRAILSRKSRKRSTPRGLLSFQKGLHTLIKAMAKNLDNALHLNTAVQKIEHQNDEWILHTKDQTFSAKKIIMTCPTKEAGSLLGNLSSDIQNTLDEIPYAPLATFHLSLKKTDLTHNLNGFGYLVAPSEKSDILGCLWNSSIFPNRAPSDSVLLTVFMGGASNPSILESEDNDLLKKAVTAIQPILNIKKHPTMLSFNRLEKAIPQYTIGHEDRIRKLRQAERNFPGLQFAGNYMGGISVGDVVRTAKNAAKF